MFSNIHSPKQSGTALTGGAIGEDVDGVSGKYFEGMKEICWKACFGISTLGHTETA